VYIRTSSKRMIFAATKGGVSDYQESIHPSAWNMHSRKTATLKQHSSHTKYRLYRASCVVAEPYATMGA
jgi:hypothetical protein